MKLCRIEMDSETKNGVAIARELSLTESEQVSGGIASLVNAGLAIFTLYQEPDTPDCESFSLVTGECL